MPLSDNEAILRNCSEGWTVQRISQKKRGNKRMNQKAWMGIKALVCLYVLYIAVSGISGDVKNGVSSHLLIIAAYGLLAAAAVCFLIVSYRMYRKTAKKLKEEQELQQNLPDKGDGGETKDDPRDGSNG
jgi:hypothetical protein